MWVETDEGVSLHGSRCGTCGLSTFPRRTFCRRCWAHSMEPVRLSASGRLYTWTVVHAAPAEFDPPYVLGYVDLPEARVLAQIDADPGDLRTGAVVTGRLGPVRRTVDGSVVTGYRFGTESAP